MYLNYKAHDSWWNINIVQLLLQFNLKSVQRELRKLFVHLFLLHSIWHMWKHLGQTDRQTDCIVTVGIFLLIILIFQWNCKKDPENYLSSPSDKCLSVGHKLFAVHWIFVLILFKNQHIFDASCILPFTKRDCWLIYKSIIPYTAIYWFWWIYF